MWAPPPLLYKLQGGDISRLPVFESHRVKWTAIPIFQSFQGSESMSFSSSADCQTPAKPGRTKSNPWWVPGTLIHRRWGAGGCVWQRTDVRGSLYLSLCWTQIVCVTRVPPLKI